MPPKKAGKKAAPKPEPEAAPPPPVDRTFERAREQFRDGNYGAALAIANQILSKDPKNTDALVLASGCHSLQGRYDRAVDVDRRAVDADPKNPQAWMTLALDLGHVGELDEAEEAYRRAADLDPKRAAAWYRLACIAARKGDADAALAHLERATAERDEYREEAKSQPEFGPLMDDPRFAKIVSPPADPDDPYAEWMRSGA